MKNNKKMIYRLLATMMISGLLVSLIGCVNIEEDLQGEITPETFFASLSDLEAAVVSSYRPLSQAFGLNERAPYYWSGDDLTTLSGGNKGNYKEYDVFTPQNTNPYISATWKGFFRSVLTANNVLNNYERVPNVTDEEKGVLAGQSAFIRGVSYFELVRTFGRVPLLTTLDVTGHEEKAEISDIYDQIIEDLTFAKNKLPTSWPGEPGRPTTYTAQAVLANVYLTSAGFPLNNSGNAVLAAAEAKSVIDNGPYQLLENFSDLFQAGVNNNNIESIYSFQFCGSCGGWGFGNFKSWQGFNWDDFFAELTFFNDFPEGARKDATFITEFPDGSYDEVGHLHPEYKKYGVYDVDGSQITNSYDQNIYYLRLSELLLIYAEAQIRASGSTSDPLALEALNRVKKRAFGDDANFVAVTSATASDVVWERAWEMAGEFSRWHDLVRTQQLSEVAANRDPSESVVILGNVDESNPYAMIPADEIALNPNLGN